MKGTSAMAMDNVRFRQYLSDEAERTRQVSFPVRSGFLRLLLVRHTACKKLHPNPEDEFCAPDIGPSYRIIEEYMQTYQQTLRNTKEYCREPIVVQRIHPSGYMILNGHHRWAAALKLGFRRIHVKVVNPTQEKDVEKMLRASRFDKRVALDLDEVIFRDGKDPDAEEPLRFPLNRIYPERLRGGIPALFHFLRENGYDIWLYSNRYYSQEYIKYLFKRHHASVTGIVTGVGRKTRQGESFGKRIEARLTKQYRHTVHIDNDAVVCVSHDTHAYREVALVGSASAGGWAQEVIRAIGAMNEHEA